MKYWIVRLLLRPPAILLATSLCSDAQPVTHVCKNATLNGTYGFLMTGQVFSTTFGFVPYSDSGSLTFDGSSKISGASSQNVDGQTSARTLNGTYTVNSDCTGNFTFTDSLGDSGGVSLVVIGSGSSIQLLENDSGTAISGNAKPQQANCTDPDISGPYGMAIRGGYYDALGAFQPFSESGKLTSDGNGNFSLNDTASTGGNLGTRSLTGKYTLNSNCTGSTTLADGSGNSTVLNFTLVSGGDEILLTESDASVIVAGSAQRQFAKAGILSHLASGSIWKTTITLENLSATPNEVRVDFYADSGSALTLPYTTTLQGNSTTGTGSSIDETINPGATLVIATEAPSSPTMVGWAHVFSSGSVAGYAIFREQLSNGTYTEGTVALEDRNISDLVVPFDNTGGFVTGVALVNSTGVSKTIDATVRDASGNKLGSATALVLPANGHLAFVSTTQYPMTKGQMGTIEFQPTSGGGIAGLGFRFSPYSSFTSVPVIVRR